MCDTVKSYDSHQNHSNMASKMPSRQDSDPAVHSGETFARGNHEEKLLLGFIAPFRLELVAAFSCPAGAGLDVETM